MPKKILLPNGCSCSMPTVHPKNWKEKNADASITWYISYWFYDASYDPRTNPKAKKQKSIRGMNDLAVLQHKQHVTQALLDDEMKLLQEDGFNAITGKFTTPEKAACESDIDPSTPLIKALWAAHAKQKGVVGGTIADIKSTITGITPVAKKLGYDQIPISKITRKHIVIMLEKCFDMNARFTANRHNKYRAWLMKLFKYLVKVEAVQHNPVNGTDVMKVTRNIRETLTLQQRINIDAYLKKNHYHFWRLMIIFFHSGARETELMRVTTKDVDMHAQSFRTLVKKSRQHAQVDRPIKNSALHLWQEVISECKDGQYLFGKLLRPGDRPIRPDQLGRRWNKHVKKVFGITADFYSLKHTNTTEMKNYISNAEIIKLTAHRTEAMIVDIYDVERKSREFEQVRNVPNTFAG